MDEGQESLTSVPTPRTPNAELDRVYLAARALQRLLPSPPAHPVDAFVDPFLLDFPGRFGSPEMISNRTRATLLILTRLFYGLPHFLGWSGVFPTSYERLLWGIATAIIASSGFFIALGGAILKYPLTFKSLKHVSVLEYAGITLVIFAYVVASSFLIIESVWQLFFLPPAAYELPSWSNYWPHFS